VLVAVAVGVLVAVAVGVLVAVAVGVLVGVLTEMEPLIALPCSLLPSLPPKETGGSLEKFTGTVVGAQPMPCRFRIIVSS